MKLSVEIKGATYYAIPSDVSSMSCKHCCAGSVGNHRDLCEPLKEVNGSCGFNGQFMGDMTGKRIHWATPEDYALWRLTR